MCGDAAAALITKPSQLNLVCGQTFEQSFPVFSRRGPPRLFKRDYERPSSVVSGTRMTAWPLYFLPNRKSFLQISLKYSQWMSIFVVVHQRELSDNLRPMPAGMQNSQKGVAKATIARGAVIHRMVYRLLISITTRWNLGHHVTVAAPLCYFLVERAA